MATLNKAELAEFLGFAERTLTEWQEEGLPIARRGEARGQANEYDTAAVVAWLLERAARKARADDPRSALWRSQTRLNEIKLAELEGELVNAAEAERGFARLVVGARQQLLMLAVRVAPALEAAAGAGAKQALLEAAIVEALKDLGDAGL